MAKGSHDLPKMLLVSYPDKLTEYACDCKCVKRLLDLPFSVQQSVCSRSTL